MNEELQSANEELRDLQGGAAVGQRGAADGQRRAEARARGARPRQQRPAEPLREHPDRHRLRRPRAADQEVHPGGGRDLPADRGRRRPADRRHRAPFPGRRPGGGHPGGAAHARHPGAPDSRRGGGLLVSPAHPALPDGRGRHRRRRRHLPRHHQLKRAEEERETLAAIVDSSQDGIIGKTLDGVITSWNAGAERLYGYSAREAVGRTLDLIVPPDQRSLMAAVFEKLRQGIRSSLSRPSAMRKNGERFDISLTFSPVRDAGGRLVGASGIDRDISDRKRAEEECGCRTDAARRGRPPQGRIPRHARPRAAQSARPHPQRLAPAAVPRPDRGAGEEGAAHDRAAGAPHDPPGGRPAGHRPRLAGEDPAPAGAARPRRDGPRHGRGPAARPGGRGSRGRPRPPRRAPLGRRGSDADLPDGGQRAEQRRQVHRAGRADHVRRAGAGARHRRRRGARHRHRHGAGAARPRLRAVQPGRARAGPRPRRARASASPWSRR